MCVCVSSLLKFVLGQFKFVYRMKDDEKRLIQIIMHLFGEIRIPSSGKCASTMRSRNELVW